MLRHRVRGLLAAAALAVSGAFLAAGLVAQAPLNRTISLRNIHTDDTVTVEYKRKGRYVPEAMERINWVMRDWRRDEATTMDPALIDLLWEMHRELGSKAPINIISGFRSKTTNNMLRRTVGGQASESRHILGKAADVQFPDVPLRQMRYAAMVRERGGVGYYPTSATPFVHVDTDRVRAWPRMPRFELALLFPNGRTLHKPAEGGDITPADVKTARLRKPEVSVQLAQFHTQRKTLDQPSLAMALVPGADEIVFTPPPVSQVALRPRPQLVAEPRTVDRPTRLSVRPSDDDRRTLTQLVALASIPALMTGPELAIRPGQVPTPKRKGSDPEVSGETAPVERGGPFPRLAFLGQVGIDALKGWSTGFAPAPEWDEDHPEEAAYRPFPLAPFLTETASVDDPALTRLQHPDLARTGELFEASTAASEQMRLRPPRLAQLMWSGGGAELTRLHAVGDDAAASPAAGRRVQVEARR